MSGTLYIVATPIGNLEDITLRAIKTFSEVDVILAEDTRVTQKLLAFLNDKFQMPNAKVENSLRFPTSNIQHPTKALLLSYHQHSNDNRKLEILKMLMDGKNIALVTDAGTPGISDPGNELISFLISQIPDLKAVPIPGASAITAALSVSGFDSSKFLFLGFWPKKKGSRVVKLIKDTGLNAVFYESPFRILKTLKMLEENFGADTKILIARELTKMYETLYRGSISEVVNKLNKGSIKGEIVVVLDFH
jgi:16S rRNA (cytidine1402-2'-O)-methyltransferase